jgi:hypothetical protein
MKASDDIACLAWFWLLCWFGSPVYFELRKVIQASRRSHINRFTSLNFLFRNTFTFWGTRDYIINIWIWGGHNFANIILYIFSPSFLFGNSEFWIHSSVLLSRCSALKPLHQPSSIVHYCYKYLHMQIYHMYKFDFSLFKERIYHTESALVYFWQEWEMWPSVHFV